MERDGAHHSGRVHRAYNQDDRKSQRLRKPGWKGIALEPTGSFSLTKWYLDCVTDAGEVAIVYATELCWRGARLHLSSVLGGTEGNVRSQTSIARCRIAHVGGRITAEAPKQELSGAWEAESAPCERTVYQSEAGAIEWKCLQPRSCVQLRMGDRSISGLGYAECLTLTVLPWSLPLKELRWGRFVSPHDSLVWVDWKGEYNTRFAMLNGDERELVRAANDEVVTADTRLRIGDGFTLRQGQLKRTILPDAPTLGKLLPRSLWGVKEQKWCSRGEMTSGDRSSCGWVIHEVVHWKG